MSFQLPLLKPSCDWRPTPLSEMPSWKGARRVAIDCETSDPNLFETGPSVRTGGYIVGYSFAIEDGPRHYLPFRHEGGDNLDERGCLSYLRDQAHEFEGYVVGANLPYDLDYMEEVGVLWPRVKRFRDVQIAEPLLNEHARTYRLDALAQQYLGEGKDTGILREAARAYGAKTPREAGGIIWRLPGRYVGAYGEGDADRPLRVLQLQERELEKQDLWKVWDLESDVLPVLLRMRRRGVRVNEGKLQRIEDWALAEEGEALEAVHRETGYRVEVGDTRSEVYAKALQRVGVEAPSTAQGNISVTADWLQELDHPAATALRRARKVNKVRTTFVASVKRHLVKGRIHCSFNQLRRDREEGGFRGAAYGRLSSEHPNMQQQPARDPEIGPMWRAIYEPEPDTVWACLDYSQQEPRWTVHYAATMKLPRAQEAADKYREDPSTDHHQMMADMTGIARRDAKEIFLGLCYGMGGCKLCNKLGLPTRWAVFPGDRRPAIYTETDSRAELEEIRRQHPKARWAQVAGREGQRLLDKFDGEVPYVKKLAKLVEDWAGKRGFVRTWSGRKCRFPALPHGGGYEWLHKSLNRLIQGSSADQTKEALVALDRAGCFLQLQVHDEVDGSFDDPAGAREAADVMENVVQLGLPSKVDEKVGPSWGEAA